MIALATPFANVVKSSVVGVTNNFNGRLDTALDEMTYKEPKEFVPGLYQTGASEVYKTQGPDAVADMLIMSYDEMVSNGFVSVSDGAIIEMKNVVSIPNEIVKNEYGFYFDVGYE